MEVVEFPPGADVYKVGAVGLPVPVKLLPPVTESKVVKLEVSIALVGPDGFTDAAELVELPEAGKDSGNGTCTFRLASVAPACPLVKA